MTRLLRLAAFQTRQLLRTSYFVQLAVATPVVYCALRSLAALHVGLTPSGLTWAHGAVAGVWATSTTAVGLIGFQRFQGTLEHLVLSPRSSASTFAPVCLAATLLGLGCIPVAIATSFVLQVPVTVQPLSAVLTGIILAFLACGASALVLAAVFVLTRNAVAYEPLLLVPVWLLSGLVIPFAEFPVVFKSLSLLHPLTSAVNVINAQPLSSAYFGWTCVSVVVSAAWTAAARRGLRIAQVRARSTGTLSLS